MKKDIDYRAIITIRGVQHRARKRFQAGIWDNPYTHDGKASSIQYITHDVLTYAMARAYNDELELLKAEKLCPCCGLTSYADVDW